MQFTLTKNRIAVEFLQSGGDENLFACGSGHRKEEVVPEFVHYSLKTVDEL